MRDIDSTINKQVGTGQTKFKALPVIQLTYINNLLYIYLSILIKFSVRLSVIPSVCLCVPLWRLYF